MKLALELWLVYARVVVALFSNQENTFVIGESFTFTLDANIIFWNCILSYLDKWFDTTFAFARNILKREWNNLKIFLNNAQLLWTHQLLVSYTQKFTPYLPDL